MTRLRWLRRGAMVVGTTIALVGLALPSSGSGQPGVLVTPTEPVPAEFSQDLTRIASTRSVGSVNSDLAFWGNTAFMGVYNSLQVVDIAKPARPKVLSQITCNGSQADVSVWDGLLFMSIDRPQTKPDCDSVSTPGNAPGWEGIRIFDVRDPTNPTHIASVATDCGSHTHTLVPDPRNGRVLLYVSSYSNSTATFGLTPWGNNCQLSHGYISVVEVPLRRPGTAQVVSKPQLPLDPYFSNGGNGCHDIGVFVELRMAAGACAGNALLFDLTDLANPRATASFGLPHDRAFWHSGAFSPDGRVAVFGDETFGGVGNACVDDNVQGRMWFFRVDPVAKRFLGAGPASSFKIPRPQDGGQASNCTAHNYNVLPIPGRYVLNAAWYTGGTSMVDFTNPAQPREIAYFDYQNVEDYSGAWSSYYYNGFTYASSMDTGLEVLRASRDADRGAVRLRHLNPQTQERTLPGVRSDVTNDAAAAAEVGPSALLWQNTQPGPQPWRTGCCCCAAGGGC